MRMSVHLWQAWLQKRKKTETVLAFDTIGTALYVLRARIQSMQLEHLKTAVEKT